MTLGERLDEGQGDARAVAESSVGLRSLLNEWDPIGVASLVQDEYDCMIGPLLSRLLQGADQAEITAFLWHVVEEHFGLKPVGQDVDLTAARVVDWWAGLRSQNS